MIIEMICPWPQLSQSSLGMIWQSVSNQLYLFPVARYTNVYKSENVTLICFNILALINLVEKSISESHFWPLSWLTRQTSLFEPIGTTSYSNNLILILLDLIMFFQIPLSMVLYFTQFLLQLFPLFYYSLLYQIQSYTYPMPSIS